MRGVTIAAVSSLALISISGCHREKRESRPAPARVAVYRDGAVQSDLQPGGQQTRAQTPNPYHGEAYAISEGARLYGWYNCGGCHSNGGGGIGPPLIKNEWIYGGEPANLFDTIVKGRPNGMPTWGGRIPEYQIWQIVAYVGSLNNQEPRAATPVRSDTIEKDPSTITNRVAGVTK